VTGPQGPAGPSGSAYYGELSNNTTEVVPIGASVVFDTPGPLFGFTTVPGTPFLTAMNAGTYLVRFSITAVESNQFSVDVNGIPVSGSTFGSGAGTQQNDGQVIVPLFVGDVVTLVNSGSPAAVQLQTLAGGAGVNVNASLIVTQLG